MKNVSLSLSLFLSLSLTLFHTSTLFLSFSSFFFFSLSNSLSFVHTHTLSLSLTHTHTHTHTLKSVFFHCITSYYNSVFLLNKYLSVSIKKCFMLVASISINLLLFIFLLLFVQPSFFISTKAQKFYQKVPLFEGVEELCTQCQVVYILLADSQFGAASLRQSNPSFRGQGYKLFTSYQMFDVVQQDLSTYHFQIMIGQSTNHTLKSHLATE